MTVCNMSIEAGARAGMIAPDDTTYAYLEGRQFAPEGQGAFAKAVDVLEDPCRLTTEPRSIVSLRLRFQRLRRR